MYYSFYLSIKDGKRAAIREMGPNDSLAVAWAIGMVFFFFFSVSYSFFKFYLAFSFYSLFFTFLFAGLHLGTFFYSPEKVSYKKTNIFK